MSNYIIENNINFFEQLKQSLNSKSTQDSNDSNDSNNSNNSKDSKDFNNSKDSKDSKEYCLISNKELTKDNTIKLLCNHKFDYVALFTEVKSFKENNFNYLKTKELRCPYCRKVQNKLLPFLPNKIKEQCYGVNFPESYTMMPNYCQYVFKSGKNKGHPCSKLCYGELCKNHLKMKEKNNNNLKSNLNMSIFLQELITQIKTNKNINLNNYTVVILKKLAKLFGLKNYSKLKKKDIIIKIKEAI